MKFELTEILYKEQSRLLCLFSDSVKFIVSQPSHLSVQQFLLTGLYNY